MPKVEYTAMLLGATGNVGGHILHLLVQSPLCKKVVVVVYAENQIPSQIDSHRLASDSQTAAGRQQQASLARDEYGCRHVERPRFSGTA